MEKLEQYLDQVCRSIGGPRSLRQHVRQELREHLLDAMTQHKAAGMAEEAALEKALEEFGRPEDVRSELEATHGQRLLPVVIDKAMQWKEMTMRARWLWTTWAHLVLATVIAMEVLFITFLVIYIIPRFQRLMLDGIIDPGILEEQGAMWMSDFLHNLAYAGGRYTTPLALLAAAVWGLFEWRVRSENKPFMRLSALGTIAVGLTVLVVVASGSMVIAFTLGAPAMGRLARPFALQQVSTIETSVGAFEQALAKKDWEAMQEHAEEASSAMLRLAHGPAITSLTARNDRSEVEALRAQLRAAHENLWAAKQAAAAKEAGRAEAALAEFRKAFGPVREAAKRPAQ